VPGPLVTDPLLVADWRRRVTEAYADVRRIALDDPAGAHAVWVQRRDELFAEHPASPLDAATRASFAGLDVAPYDPAFRFEVEVQPATRQRLDVSTGTDGVVTFERVGSVELPRVGSLALWALHGYGGGLFLPVRDALAGLAGGTFGGGRYLLDTVKGADLGWMRGLLVVDLNFAYNPTCAYEPAWACPLATRANTVAVELPVGERTWVARDWDDETADAATTAAVGPALDADVQAHAADAPDAPGRTPDDTAGRTPGRAKKPHKRR
jgi:uncharacterized protein (DUF1684 family)